MIEVTPHARTREDRAGDPLDGLVNLFDLGIVLAGRVPARGAVLAAPRRNDHQPWPARQRCQDIYLSQGRRWRRCRSPAQDDRPRHRGGRRLPPRRRSARLRSAGAPRTARRRMGYLWEQLRAGRPADRERNSYILGVTWVTIRVALLVNGMALVHRPAVRARARPRPLPRPAGAAHPRKRDPGDAARARRGRLSCAAPAERRIRRAAHRVHAERRVRRRRPCSRSPTSSRSTPAAIQGLPPGLLGQARALGAGGASSRCWPCAKRRSA